MEKEIIKDGKCLLCDNNEMQFLNMVRDSDKKVYRCQKCGHVQIYPIPQEDEYDAFYQTNMMGRITVSQNMMDDEALRQKNKVWVDKHVETAKRIIPKDKKIFEIGSGYGWFLKAMREAGYEADGLEISTDKCASARELLGIDVYNTKFPIPNNSEDFKSLYKRYDYVCIYHVLEHVPDPVSFLASSKDLLRGGGGTVLAEVPNFNDYMKHLSEPYNYFSYLKAHLSYFTPDILKKVFEEAGFRDVEVYGDQKYSFTNAVRWLNEGKPNLMRYEFDAPQGLKWLDDYYKAELERTLKSYTIYAIGHI